MKGLKMNFPLKEKEIVEEMKRRLDIKSAKYNEEMLRQYANSKISAVNQNTHPIKKKVVKTEVKVETIRGWVVDFIRTYDSRG